MADSLRKTVAEYLDAFKRRDVAALKRAARNSRQVGFSKERWSHEMERQCKGDTELEAMLVKIRASHDAHLAAEALYTSRRKFTVADAMTPPMDDLEKWKRGIYS